MARRGVSRTSDRTRGPQRRKGGPPPVVVGAVVAVVAAALVVLLGTAPWKKQGPAREAGRGGIPPAGPTAPAPAPAAGREPEATVRTALAPEARAPKATLKDRTVPPPLPTHPRAPAAPDAEFEIGWDEEDVSDAATAGRGESIWIEGESSRRHDFTRHSWYDRVKKNVLSGTDWLSHYDGNRPGEAAYDFEVKEGGEYAFWMRLNPFKVKMAYQLDGGSWVDIDTGKVRDRLMISQKPDHRYIAWASAGRVELRPGRHTVRVRVDGKIRHSGGIDCLTLTMDRTFVPSGVTRPGEVAALETGPADWFPVIVDDDTFSERSVIDMTSLVHRPAGKYGFLRRKGRHLVFSKRPDVPVKFWGVGANIDDKLGPAEETQRVRYLVKHGVNMARQHSVLGYLGPLKGGRFDAKKMDSYDRWFAELKKHGVYMTWSVFYPLRISAGDGYPPDLFAELEKGSASGLVNFSRKLQDLEFAYVKKLLEHRNRYTGLRYRDDPALAMMEVHNEDCIFWHGPLNRLPDGKKWPKHTEMLRDMWRDWLKERYGSDSELRRAWGTNDSLSGRLKLYGAWEMKGDRPDRRIGDFIRFLTDVQRGYYERREKEVRAAGFKAVSVTTAWRAGGPAADPANLYCDTAMDMINRHNYFGGGAGGHHVREGKVNNATHLARAGSGILSSGFYQVEDRPFSMTEWTVLPPNRWKAEIAPLYAFYGMGLQGWDASYHFLNSRARIGDGWPGLSSYTTDTPHYIGQFPAIAFAIYKGHIKEAPVVAARRLKVDDLFTGLDPLSQDFTGGGWDEKALKGNLQTPMEVLAVGRVTVSFDGRQSERFDWAECWDKGRSTVRSVTGEHAWDMSRRVVTITSPKTQAVIGFAGGAAYDLPGVKVYVKTPFVSLIFTPLDDRPLVDSKHVLITAMSKDKQTGTEYAGNGTNLRVVGGPPLLMEPVMAKIRLEGEAPGSVEVLDFYGVPTGRRLGIKGGEFAISGRYRTYYYEVKR